MKLKLKITRNTTNSELVHLGNFFTALGLNKGAKVFAAPTDPAELDEGDVTYVPTPPLAADVAIVNATDTGVKIIEPEAPKKRRRTKAEIEAEIAAREAANKVGPFYWSHPESDSAGTVATRAELDICLASDPCVQEITAEQYEQFCIAKDHAAMNAGVHAGSAIPSHEGKAGNEQPAATQTATATDTGSAGTEAAASEPASASPSEPPTPVSLNIKATAVAKKIGPEKIKAKIIELGGKLISTLSPEALVEFDAWLDAQ